jgi:hypothetical protein
MAFHPQQNFFRSRYTVFYIHVLHSCSYIFKEPGNVAAGRDSYDSITRVNNLYWTKQKRMQASSVTGCPHFADAHSYNFVDDCFWVGVFWTGQNYLCYEMSGDSTFIDNARRSRHRFVKRLYDDRHTTDHDLGFLCSLSAIAD